jgi:hypothetical protein
MKASTILFILLLLSSCSPGNQGRISGLPQTNRPGLEGEFTFNTRALEALKRLCDAAQAASTRFELAFDRELTYDFKLTRHECTSNEPRDLGAHQGVIRKSSQSNFSLEPVNPTSPLLSELFSLRVREVRELCEDFEQSKARTRKVEDDSILDILVREELEGETDSVTLRRYHLPQKATEALGDLQSIVTFIVVTNPQAENEGQMLAVKKRLPCPTSSRLHGLDQVQHILDEAE